MKNLLFCTLTTLVLLTGCSSYQTKLNVDPIAAPDSVAQILRNSPMIRAAQNTVFFNRNTVDDFSSFLKNYKNATEPVKITSGEAEEISITKFSASSLKKLVTGKIFIDIEYIQDTSLLTYDTPVLETDTNYKYDNKRKKIFYGLIEDEMTANGFDIVKNLHEADYKMKIIVFEDGLTSKKTIGFLYMTLSRISTIGLNIKFTDNETGKNILAYTIKNKSYINKNDILYFITQYSYSKDLNMEY